MNWLYLLSGGLALLVFVYLVVALFYPEKSGPTRALRRPVTAIGAGVP